MPYTWVDDCEEKERPFGIWFSLNHKLDCCPLTSEDREILKKIRECHTEKFSSEWFLIYDYKYRRLMEDEINNYKIMLELVKLPKMNHRAKLVALKLKGITLED